MTLLQRRIIHFPTLFRRQHNITTTLLQRHRQVVSRRFMTLLQRRIMHFTTMFRRQHNVTTKLSQRHRQVVSRHCHNVIMMLLQHSLKHCQTRCEYKWCLLIIQYISTYYLILSLIFLHHLDGPGHTSNAAISWCVFQPQLPEADWA